VRVILAVNPTADRGRAAGAGAGLASRLADAGHEVEVARAADADSLRDLVARHLLDTPDRLVIAGGDGLVHALLPAVAGTEVPIGIVPLGTGNDVARAFSLPTEPGPALQTALGPWRTVDAIKVGDGWAASVATAGFSGTVNARANRMGWPRGQGRYTVATLIELPRLRPFPLSLVVDGVRTDLSCSLVAVGNTSLFGGGMAICPEARPDDGLLDVTVVQAVSPLTLARVFPRVFAGRHLQHPAVRTFRGQSVELLAEGVDLWADGEPAGPLPARLECVPAALRIAAG
jgi:diacylglycerol kinase (ATP)